MDLNKIKNCQCNGNGLLHWQITQKDYDELPDEYKNCGIVFFIKNDNINNSGTIVRNGVTYSGSGGSGGGAGDVDWQKIEEFINTSIEEKTTQLSQDLQQFITHNVGLEIDKIEESLSSSMDTVKQNIIEELQSTITSSIENMKSEITEELESYIDEQLANVVCSDDIDWIDSLTEAEYEALTDKKAKTMYIIPAE